ncbi:MAG: hypothetical protein M1829_006852 [Trizodia sp. TS-e1964]|nr:MAG: hypothetical protein M1829_006852 [Trizodia sp. TS-e1964]
MAIKNDNIYDYQAETTLRCWPSIYGTTKITSLLLISGKGGAGYYSPRICPSGWSTASTARNFIGTRNGTVAKCCPESYTLTYPDREGAQCSKGVPYKGSVTNFWSVGSNHTGQPTFGPTDYVRDITVTLDTHVACSPICVVGVYIYRDLESTRVRRGIDCYDRSGFNRGFFFFSYIDWHKHITFINFIQL